MFQTDKIVRVCCWLALSVVCAANTGCCINRFGCGCDGMYVDCGECCGRTDCYDGTPGIGGGGCGAGCDCGDCCGDCVTPYQYGCGCLGDCGLMRCLASQFSSLTRCVLCPSGCGEVYVDEWLSDPPDCCDPCNPCGNWTPKGCCLPRECHLYDPTGFGYRPPSCGCGGGCARCASGPASYVSGRPHLAGGSHYGGPHLADHSNCQTCQSGQARSREQYIAEGYDIRPGETIVYDESLGRPEARTARNTRSRSMRPGSRPSRRPVIWPNETRVTR